MKILAIGAHPDDIEAGCAGTLAKYAQSGHEVHLLVMTEGGMGGESATRKKEQTRSTKVLRPCKLTWGGYKDTLLSPHMNQMVYEIEDVLKKTAPDLIFVHYVEDTHQDHRALAEATITATREVHGFSEVVLRGYGDLDIEQRGDALGKETIEIEADEELGRRILTEVRGNRLVLGFSMPWYEWLTWWLQWLFISSKKIRYRLTAGRLEGLSISGAGTVTFPRLDSKRLELRISGAGRIRGSALKVGELAARVSGSGTVELAGAMDRCEVSISGAGTVELAGTADRCEASISGSGNVRAAELQAPRVAAARHLSAADAEKLLALVKSHEEGPQLGFLGEPRVNVLSLNMALDQAFPG